MFRKADADKDMKLNAMERKALRESLENKKVCLIACFSDLFFLDVHNARNVQLPRGGDRSFV